MKISNDLLTVRDLLRYAVSRFNQAGLSYGHGTETAIDEAAFLILEAFISRSMTSIPGWMRDCCRANGNT